MSQCSLKRKEKGGVGACRCQKGGKGGVFLASEKVAEDAERLRKEGGRRGGANKGKGRLRKIVGK